MCNGDIRWRKFLGTPLERRHSCNKRETKYSLHRNCDNKMSGSGIARAASADLTAQSDLDSDNKQISLPSEEPVEGIEFKSYEEPVKSHSEGKRKLDAEIPSTSQGKPRSKKILSEIQPDAQSDDGQQRLPRQSVYDKNPRRISREEWVNYMKGDSHLRNRRPSFVSIFRVPKFLKDTKTEAYEPQTVSLGPYHNKSEKLVPMDDLKRRALRRMMMRYNTSQKLQPDDMVFADKATNVILSVVDKIKDIYEESIDCDGETLAWMLCLDGCCILEVLRTLGRNPNESDELYERNDPIFWENKLAASNILKDIVMLENQIPWIVLHELLQLENPEDGQVLTTLLNLLAHGTLGLFKISGQNKSGVKKHIDQVKKSHHLLGFLHKVIVDEPSIDDSPRNQYLYRFSIKSCIGHLLLKLQDENKALNHDFESIPTAVELKNAGIKFEPCKGGISGISFNRKRAIIYLPVVCITYGTEVLFRNLIAFEICRPSEPNYVSSYVNLMDDLIDSQKDVALLRSMGILTKLIGSDKEVADLFNGLCKDVGTMCMENMFDELRKDVNAHIKFKIRVQLEDIVQNHCSSPWKVSTLVAASLIACFGLLQTIFTILSYLFPRNSPFYPI